MTESCGDCPHHLSHPVISPLPVCFQSPQLGRADAAKHGLQKTGDLDLCWAPHQASSTPAAASPASATHEGGGLRLAASMPHSKSVTVQVLYHTGGVKCENLFAKAVKQLPTEGNPQGQI